MIKIGSLSWGQLECHNHAGFSVSLIRIHHDLSGEPNLIHGLRLSPVNAVSQVELNSQYIWGHNSRIRFMWGGSPSISPATYSNYIPHDIPMINDHIRYLTWRHIPYAREDFHNYEQCSQPLFYCSKKLYWLVKIGIPILGLL